jgi:hypothetical protein
MDSHYIENVSELKKISRDDLPLLVFSTNFIGLFAYLVRLRTNSVYSHFMWMHEPGKFASQQFTFSSVPVEKFAKCTLKLVCNPTWTRIQRALLTERIYAELEKPKWQTRYDYLNLVGQLIGIKAIQNPCTNICSETANFLRLIDDRYCLCNPTPDEVNGWVNQNPDYKLHTRYTPD